MTFLNLSPEDRKFLTFFMFNSISYPVRLCVGFGIIACALVLQWVLYENSASYFGFKDFLLIMGPASVIFFIGNLFLFTDGFDNSIEIGKYEASSGWEQVEYGKLLEVEQLVKKMEKWSSSALDVSSGKGCLPFLVLLGIFLLSLFYFFSLDKPAWPIVCLDISLVLLPHWVFGSSIAMTQPNLLEKIMVFKKLITHMDDHCDDFQVDFFMLLKGRKKNVPDDVKLRVQFTGQDPDFLGLYGHIVLNRVKSNVYPYFYAVLVAKKGFGLSMATAGCEPSSGLMTEYNEQGDAEVFVIRQQTTKTFGYHTDDGVVRKIFREGLGVARHAAIKNG